MIYGLVIVTSLGATTLLATFPTYLDCVKEQALIAKSPISQAQCWPGRSAQELEDKIHQINQTISNARVIVKP